MHRISRQTPLILLLLVVLSLSLPKSLSSGIQNKVAAFFSVFWRGASWLFERDDLLLQEKEQLILENQLLRNERESLKEMLLQETFLDQELFLAKEDHLQLASLKPQLKKRRQELEKLLRLEIYSIPAKIIYRPIQTWSRTFWINVGKKTNLLLERDVVAKGSPVVFGKSLVGVVEEVEENISRVRLLTDGTLCPSVRVLRKEGEVEVFLAKGILKGSQTAFYRSFGTCLQGVGFNYDFPDEEGPARDLRSGQPLGVSTSCLKEPLVKEGDLLVTTGMDALFPAGLKAGIVTRVIPVQDSDYTLSLEAAPFGVCFDQLKFVFVLPPKLPEIINE